MSPLLVALVALAGLGAVALVVRWFALDVLRTSGRRSAHTPQSLGLAADAFEIPAAAGTLRGWIMRAAPVPRPTLVFVHGWNSNAGDMLLWAAPLVRAGYHAVAYDTLGHGESDPSTFTSIRHFVRDLHAVLRYVRTEPETGGIVLFGHSMGGAACLLVAGDVDAAQAVIVAGAPTDPVAITREWLDGKHLPGGLLVMLMRPFWRRIVRAPVTALRPIARMRALRHPVLILHGTDDRHVSARHAAALADAASHARLVLLPGGTHFNLPLLPGYLPAVTEFLEEVFQDGKRETGDGGREKGGGRRETEGEEAWRVEG